MPGKARMVPRSELGLETWKDEDGNEAEILTLDENDLYEISATGIPANAACVTQNAARVLSLRSATAGVGTSRALKAIGRSEIAEALAAADAGSEDGDLLKRAAAKLGMPEDMVRQMAEQVLGSTATKAAPKREPQPVVPAPARACPHGEAHGARTAREVARLRTHRRIRHQGARSAQRRARLAARQDRRARRSS
jgi:hypothetical protein